MKSVFETSSSHVYWKMFDSINIHQVNKQDVYGVMALVSHFIYDYMLSQMYRSIHVHNK